MGTHQDKFVGTHWDPDDKLLLRARTLRAASIDWLPPRREYPILHSMLVKPPGSYREMWLVVFKAETEDGFRVGFHKGSTLIGAIAQGLWRVYHGGIAWKEETPYRPPRG